MSSRLYHLAVLAALALQLAVQSPVCVAQATATVQSMAQLPPDTITNNQTVNCLLPTFDAQLTNSINHWGGHGWHTVSAVASDALLPLTLGIPAGLFVAGHVQSWKGTTSASSVYVSETGLQALVSEIFTYGVIVGAKAAFNRQRPFEAYPTCIEGYQHPYGTSMPSGHAAGAANLATTLSLRYPNFWVVFPSVTYAVIVGMARMHLGVHYLTDVLVGYAIGIGSAVLVNALNRYLFDVASPILPSDPSTQTAIVPLATFSVSL